ncbi:MAG: DUF1990 family protein [Bacteroidetes bacterium]|nr:DUF1990 family protein [Bacteroidota bacterium]
MTYDKNRLTEKTSIIHIGTTKKIDTLNLQFLFDYKIFPVHIMTYLTEWNNEKRKIKIGDTIIQQVYLPPTKTFSQKLIFGVRINEIIDQPDKKGFSYETLEGHVEKGVSTFTIEQTEKETIFKIHTFSTPANFLTKLLGSIFSVPYQTFCTNTALKNVKQQIEKK